MFPYGFSKFHLVGLLLFVLFGLLELLIIHRYSRVHFELKFVDGQPLAVVRRKKFFLPFTYETKCYTDITKVFLQDSTMSFFGIAFCLFLGVFVSFLFFVFLVLFLNRYCLFMHINKKKKLLFGGLFAKKQISEYEQQINDAIANSEGCKIEYAPFGLSIYFIMFILLFALIAVRPFLIFKDSFSVGLIIIFVGFTTICCLISLFVNLLNRIRY